jgi:hypothetical protein
MEKLKCLYCEKVIEGFSMKQVEYLMKQHILAKHPDKNQNTEEVLVW